MITNQPHSSIFNIVILLLWLMTDSVSGHHPQSHHHNHNHAHKHHRHALHLGVDDGGGNYSMVEHRHKKPLFNEKTDRERIQEAVRILRQPVHRLHMKTSTTRASIASTTEATHHHRLRHHHDHNRLRQEATRSPTTSHVKLQAPWWVDSSVANDSNKNTRWPQHSKGYSSLSRNHDRSHHPRHYDREESTYHVTSIRPVRASPRGNPDDLNVSSGRARTASLLLKSNERSTRTGHGVNDKRTHDDEEQDDSLRNTTTNFFATSQRRRSYDPDDISAPGYRPGDLTNHKFMTLGTREGVQQSRSEYMNNQRRIQAQVEREAMEHTSRILHEAECKWPRPKVIPVPNNDTAKTYTPHCTILHRCDDDTACCIHEGMKCTALETTTVRLYFHVTNIGRRHSIEQLTFVNHTRCHCVNRNSATQESYTLPPALIQSCKCPRFFEKQHIDDGSCRCECHDEICNLLSTGEEAFSLEDRTCIRRGDCKLPTCEFGNYNSNAGRCPRREDKIRDGRRVGSSSIL
ncbi:sarcoplasmic reticulum histidine-rich calcium-binding protein [Sergentomyia squamirostris]